MRVVRSSMGYAALGLALLAGACEHLERPQEKGFLPRTVEELNLNVAGTGAPTGLTPPPAPIQDRIGGRPPAGPIIVHGVDRAPAAPAGASGPGAVELNFSDTPVAAVVKTVLGDILRLPYVIDPKVQGMITLNSARPLSPDEALALLESGLRLIGGALVRSPDGYKVVSFSEAHPGTGAPLPVASPGTGVSVYLPRYTSADSLKRILEPLYGMPGAMQVMPGANLLAVTASGGDRRTLIEAAQAFDQDWVARQSIGIFPLTRAGPKAVIDELEVILSGSGKEEAGATYRMVPIERINGVMVVTRQARQLDQIAGWIRALDMGGDGERAVFVRQLQHAKARDLARVLGRLFGQGGGGDTGAAASSLLPPGTQGAQLSTPSSASGAGASSPFGMPTPGSAGAGFGGGMGGSPPGATGGGMGTGMGSSPGSGTGSGTGAGGGGQAAAHARDRAAEDAASDAGGAGGKGPRVVADEASNALLVMATPAEYRLIEGTINKLDIAPVQVMIEATIAEVTLNDALRFGVQYYLKGNGILKSDGSSMGFTTNGPFDPKDPLASVAPLPLLPGYNAILGQVGDPRVVISALDQVAKVRVLSSPQVVVRDNQTALLKVGDQVPVQTQQLIFSQSSGNVANSFQYRDTGVILTVTPRVNASGQVTMEVAQEVSNVTDDTANSLTPKISQRRIESVVTVGNGQTVALGGLIAEQGSDGRNGLPLLSDIPVVGALFSVSSRNNARRELIVFITPRVLRNGDDAKRMTDDLMERMRAMNKPPPRRLLP